jgi:multicomponent Na+:H+ antiporter subunit F
MDAALSAVLALLLVSGALVATRLVRGPSTVDRAVALDAMVAVLMAGIGLHSAVQRTPYYLPALLVLSFLGFTGTVSVARFMALRDETGDEAADTDTAGNDVAPGVGGNVRDAGERDGPAAGPTRRDADGPANGPANGPAEEPGEQGSSR